MTTTREILAEATLTRQMVDRFLDPEAHNWAVFDPELGYLLKSSIMRDGMDDSYTLAHYAPRSHRQMVNYVRLPCRINTYGDSFTQCHQVSDGETWQEILAAHLGEPLRNYGVGGFGVYQAYRRMLREEERTPAEYVILNVWSDDHNRSIYSWRWLHTLAFRRGLHARATSDEAYMFHSNPWSHLWLDPETTRFVERPNPYPTPESLYLLCDADHVVESFQDRFDVQAFLAKLGVSDARTDILQATADALELPTDWSSTEEAARTAGALLWAVALRSSMLVVDRALDFARSRDKQLMVLLSYSSNLVAAACRGESRPDQPFVEYLAGSGVLYVDGLQAHVDDYASFSCAPDDYVSRYYDGHYNPTGNHFFAFAIKDALVDWLDPRPVTYAPGGPSIKRLASELA